MSEDDFKVMIKDKLDSIEDKTSNLTKKVHEMEVKYVELRTKFGMWWVGLAILNVSGVDVPRIMSVFGN
jgi:hypothetical protein